MARAETNICPTKLHRTVHHHNKPSSLLQQHSHTTTHFHDTNCTIQATMSGRIPTSTSVSESAVIEAPFSDVWHLIKLQDFSKFWSALDKSEFVKGTSDEADVVKWAFKDGTVVEVKQEEHSVRSTALHL
jgi:hypothetical protein